MGKHQRQKGKRGEREAAKALRQIFGVSAIRAAQANGKYSEDLLRGLPGCHHEVKFYESHACLKFVRRALEDCSNQVPVVLLRENGDPEFYVLVPLRDSYRFAEAVLNTPNARVFLVDSGGVRVSSDPPRHAEADFLDVPRRPALSQV